MPEKHLFVNFSHYQDRPDPNMRHKIASHAARYGPNGSLAFKALPDGTNQSAAQPMTPLSNKHSPRQVHSIPGTPLQRSLSMQDDAHFGQDYETMLARFDNLCACSDSMNKRSKPSGRIVHSEECSLIDDYLALCTQHELPFRVFSFARGPTFLPTGGPNDDTLVLQCFLVASQAAVDGLDPMFKGKASKQTLTLQQRALSTMQRVITKSPNTVDDSLVIASAVLMSTAVCERNLSNVEVDD